MAKKIVTLFIRDTGINLLVMKGNQVDRWASLPLEPGLVIQGIVLDEAQVADRVKDLFRLEKVTARKVIVGLSGLNSLYRLITVPELPEAILAEAVRHEARRVVPVSLDEVYLSYQSVPAPKGETRVFLVAFPRNVADALLRTCKLAGLEPYIMDLAPLALCRIPDEPRAIIVNTRLDHCEIMVMEDRLPQIIRRVALPSEAESLADKLPTIAEEFSRTVAFYNSSHLEQPLDATVPVFICGELAAEPETWPSLVGRLASPVSLLPSPVGYPEAFPTDEFMVNIGLALKRLPLERERANSSIVNINILPEGYLPQALPMTQIFTSIGIVVAVGLIVYMGFLVQGSRADTAELRSKLVVAESNITDKQGDIATLKKQIEPLEAQIEPAETEIELAKATRDIFMARLTSLDAGRAQVDEDLREIVSLRPTEVNLAGVDYDAASVTMRGVAQDENTVFQYARALRESGRFPRVIISSIQQVTISSTKVDGEQVEIKGFSFAFLLGEGG